MLLPSQRVQGDVSVDVEIKTKNRFKIDLVDYIPLADRRRLAVSGCPIMWNANLAAASLAFPRILKEIFLADFGQTAKSVNSLSPNNHTDNCDARDSQISPQHLYSAMLQDGRVVEVMINNSIVSNSVQANSADFIEGKGSPKDSSLRSASLNLHKASVPTSTIKVNFEQCSNVIRMETDTSESVRDELDNISLQKRSRLLFPCSQFDQSKLPQTSKQIPTEAINCTSSPVHSSHLATDENDLEINLTPSYSQKSREVIGHSQGFSVSDREEYNFDDQTEECNMSLSTSGSYNLQENDVYNSTCLNPTTSYKSHQPIGSAIPHHRKRIKLKPLQENDNDRNSKEKVIFEQENIWCHLDRVTDSSPLAFHVPVKKEPVEVNYSDSCPQLVVTSPKLHSEIAVNCGKCISSQGNSVYHPEKNPPIVEQNQATFDTNGQVLESPSTAFSFKIKPEPFVEKIDDIVFESVGKHSNGCSSSVLPLKVTVDPFGTLKVPLKMEINEDFFVDEMDRIPLRKRREMLLCIRAFDSKIPKESQSSASTENHYVHQRKRKKTATDSVETALKEDAPGLLQVLTDTGVNLKDIKLYETMNDDDSLSALDIDSSEDCFDEFENVIARLFSKCPNMLFKVGSLQDDRGSKAYYSLTCLVSLIEQIRHMRSIKCPVEWGWCRDLQSFIFVFEKHNRIVLERPEYGYATYFFELVEAFPVDWQVKRLVTTMKLTKYSRVTLIENKPLMIGEDLSEGEARVLEDYGWTPNSGLGSLLNFVDRVVHDRKSEMNSSEWRSKIGKLLMNGYYGGQLVIANLPKKVSEYMNNQHTVKLEL